MHLHVLPRMNGMLNFICIDLVDLWGTMSKQNILNEKFLSTVGFESAMLWLRDHRILHKNSLDFWEWKSILYYLY